MKNKADPKAPEPSSSPICSRAGSIRIWSSAPPPDPAFRGPNNPTGDSSGVSAAENIRRNDSVQNGASVLTGQPTPDPITSGPPPGLVDLASVEWSYLDPQGKMQGRCTMMYEVYFTS